MAVLNKHGYAPSSRTFDNKTLCCGRPGTLHKTELVDVKWWRRLRSSRGLPIDDNDLMLEIAGTRHMKEVLVYMNFYIYFL